MRIRHGVLAAVSVTFVGVLTWTLQHHSAPAPAVLHAVSGRSVIPMAAADMPGGLDEMVRQLSDLLETGQAEQALRRCWAPSNLERMDRSGLFARCAEYVQGNEKLPPTLKRLLAVGPTKTYRTQEGVYCAEFDENIRALVSIRFIYVKGHWYVT